MNASVFNLIVHPKSTLRRRRRQARLRHLMQSHRRRVVVGASGAVPAEWVGSEIDDLNLLEPSGWERFFPAAALDAILAEHVWEHLTLDQGRTAAGTCFRFLRSGGYLRVAVPDGFHPDPGYIRGTRPGGDQPGADDHKVLYNYSTLPPLFQEAGFHVVLLEYFDEAHEFHRAPWDPEKGMIRRSSQFDPRNQDGQLNYTSLILDAIKP